MLTLDQKIAITMTRCAIIVKNRAGTRVLTTDMMSDNLVKTMNKRLEKLQLIFASQLNKHLAADTEFD